MRFLKTARSPHDIQAFLLRMAGFFLFLYAIILTLAPAARERSWDVDYRWSHWLGFAIWLVVFIFAQNRSGRYIPDADPYILPIAALLTGWGVLTIYRLIPGFGLRQSLWLLLCGIILIFSLRIAPELKFLRRYKYLWLTAGLFLTALTLFLGTNPAGTGLHLWLGCCGVYFQPSEPLKLLFIIYMAAYLADRMPLSLRPLPLLAPTAFVMAIALLLLIIQRDLGTASIFIVLYTVILYVASGKKRILLISLAGLAIAGVAGYFLFDVVRLRVDAWLNPWLDPSGRSFQIVQSLMAVANGGTSGRGPGLGSPGLVPVAISDFVFVAISEEIGLVGSLGLFILVGYLVTRGLRIAMRAPDDFRRILAAGLAMYLGVQTILIIGGNIRLLPLTGVTLPFVSYGGSSLLTSFLSLIILLLISSQPEHEPAPLARPQPYLVLTALIGVGLFALAATNAWWVVWRGPDILERTDNARRSIADRYIKRGSLLDRHENPINLTLGSPGEYVRTYVYPDLAPIIGYTNPIYGQSGLEASLDLYLRGLKGNPASSIWWDHLVYGQPPPGLDVRLSIDLELQRMLDGLLGSNPGAGILINAASGEILALASHPTFDPNLLEEQASTLLQDPGSPLLDRVLQASYPPGEALKPFLLAAGYTAQTAQDKSQELYTTLGFYRSPDLQLPVTAASTPGSMLRLSPLQMVLAAAALSNAGTLPTPRLAMAVDTPSQGWVILPAVGDPAAVFTAVSAAQTAGDLMVTGQPLWQWDALASQDGKTYSWSMGGTLPDWQGAPLAVVILLEGYNPVRVRYITETLLTAATLP